jgi:hypothetical protein
MTGVFSAIDITKANVHDIAYLEDVKWQLSNAVLLGDKGCISGQQQLPFSISLHSFEDSNEDKSRGDRQKNYKKQPFAFRKT